MYESNIPFSKGYGRKVLTKSGVGISRKCCFPHGLSRLGRKRQEFESLTVPTLSKGSGDYVFTFYSGQGWVGYDHR